MRILIELAALFFALMTIYRRLIQPFLDGMKGSSKSKAGSDNTGSVKFKSSSQKKNIVHPDPKQIQDAEFEEIK